MAVIDGAQSSSPSINGTTYVECGVFDAHRAVYPDHVFGATKLKPSHVYCVAGVDRLSRAAGKVTLSLSAVGGAGDSLIVRVDSLIRLPVHVLDGQGGNGVMLAAGDVTIFSWDGSGWAVS